MEIVILVLPLSHIIVIGLIFLLSFVGLWLLSTSEEKTNVINKSIYTKNYIFANFLVYMIWLAIGVVLLFSIAGFIFMIYDFFNKS